MKKLYLISFLSFLSYWLVVVAANYIISSYYEIDFLKQNNWKEDFSFLTATIILALVTAFLVYRRQPFLKKFLVLFSAFCTILTIIVAIDWAIIISQIKANRDQLVNEFTREAEYDIKNDNVKVFSQGFPIPPKNESLQIQDDTIKKILKKFGLTRENLGCTISPELTKAQEEYQKITEVYLEKRNGKNWRDRMENEIEKVRNHR